jgi:hypothetical protein
MAGIVPIRVAGFILLAASGAFCQQLSPRFASNSLPDAPSTVASVRQASPLTPIGVATFSSAFPMASDVARTWVLRNIGRPAQTSFALRSTAEIPQRSSSDFFDKYLYPALLRRNNNYHPSGSDSLMGRAMYAASRIFVTRDESGRGRVNTSYLVAVMSSAAIHVANRPYYRRSASAPFSDFGSSVGNDAGMNLLHEFRPGLEQLMKNHAPRFVTKIEERVSR